MQNIHTDVNVQIFLAGYLGLDGRPLPESFRVGY